MGTNLGPITELRKFFLRWIEALFLPVYNGRQHSLQQYVQKISKFSLVED